MAATLVAAGCGSSSSGPYSASKADFAAALNTICVSANAKSKALGISSLSGIASKGSQQIAIGQSELASLKKLGTPPASIKTDVTNIISQTNTEITLFDQVITAAKANDTAKATQLEAQFSALDTSMNPDFTAIGAPACLSSAS